MLNLTPVGGVPPPSQPRITIKDQGTGIGKLTMPSNQKFEPIPREPVVPKEPTAKIYDPDIERASKDAATREFLFKLKTWSDIGQVRSLPSGPQQLWIGERMVIEAPFIRQVRSISDNGTVAVATTTRKITSTSADEKSSADDLPGAIWVIDNLGHAKRISSLEDITGAPLISRDGKKVAYVIKTLQLSGQIGQACVVVVDLQTNKARYFRNNEILDEYRVFPVEWNEGANVLKIMEDYGETGGHMVMRAINL
jgi:Tol biopolymer transport system component